MKQNINTLIKEINWLERVISQVIPNYLKQEGHEHHWQDIPLPVLGVLPMDYYGTFIKK